MVIHWYRERPDAALTHRLQGLGRLYATHIDLLLVAVLGAIILAEFLNLPSDIFAHVTALTAQWSILNVGSQRSQLTGEQQFLATYGA